MEVVLYNGIYNELYYERRYAHFLIWEFYYKAIIFQEIITVGNNCFLWVLWEVGWGQGSCHVSKYYQVFPHDMYRRKIKQLKIVFLYFSTWVIFQ